MESADQQSPTAIAADIPPTRLERDTIERLARAYHAALGVPRPCTLDTLRHIADGLLQEAGLCACYRDYTCVILHNACWREQVAAVPCDRRLLLLPQCLRDSDRCRAGIDPLGLICAHCRSCSIHDLQTHAEQLGYAVLVAEGTAVVLELLKRRSIQAVIGVSCLSVLERAFGHLFQAGIPALAIPLLSNTCRDSLVDQDLIWQAIHLNGPADCQQIDLDLLADRLAPLFTPAGMEALLGPADGGGEVAARAFLCAGGKRRRPLLTAATALTLLGDTGYALPDGVARLALAVECFHKASLVHDDIEDDDDTRDGRHTLHRDIGTAAAINAGDYLLGEGYRLLASCHSPRLPALLDLATRCHHRLCRGQGWELDWRGRDEQPGPEEIIEQFRHKTSPAFVFSIGLGALLGDRDEPALSAITTYGDHFGIAYQIRDDRHDAGDGRDGGDLRHDRPSLALALLHRRCDDAERAAIAAWRRGDASFTTIRALLDRHAILQEMAWLEADHRQRARDAILALDDLPLRSLLLRVITRTFDDLHPEAWGCRPTRHL